MATCVALAGMKVRPESNRLAALGGPVLRLGNLTAEYFLGIDQDQHVRMAWNILDHLFELTACSVRQCPANDHDAQQCGPQLVQRSHTFVLAIATRWKLCLVAIKYPFTPAVQRFASAVSECRAAVGSCCSTPAAPDFRQSAAVTRFAAIRQRMTNHRLSACGTQPINSQCVPIPVAPQRGVPLPRGIFLAAAGV